MKIWNCDRNNNCNQSTNGCSRDSFFESKASMLDGIQRSDRKSSKKGLSHFNCEAAPLSVCMYFLRGSVWQFMKLLKGFGVHRRFLSAHG